MGVDPQLGVCGVCGVFRRWVYLEEVGLWDRVERQCKAVFSMNSPAHVTRCQLVTQY